MHIASNQWKVFVKDNKILLIIFLISTIFFLFQHYLALTWDFSSYVLNARCLFYEGAYCETQRPPLASVFLATFIIFGAFGEYIYIFIISLLFLYSSIRISDAFFKNNLNQDSNIYVYRFIFYFFSLSSFTLLFGMKEGTELLTLSLLELAFAQILEKRNAGFYLGLAFLARYSSLAFMPLLLFHPKFKGVLKNVASFLLILFPWFLYNFAAYGNWFTGFVDGYAQNIYLRKEIMPFSLQDVLAVTGYFTIPLALGLIIAVSSMITSKRDFWKNNKQIIFMLLITALILWNYQQIPTKYPRYLFNLALPIAFFSSFIFTFYKYLNEHKEIISILILLLFLITSAIVVIAITIESRYALPFKEASKDIISLGLENCEILSPHWVPVTYYTENVYPSPFGRDFLSRSIEEKKIILVFGEPSLENEGFASSDLKNLPILYKSKEYTFYGEENIKNTCKKKYIFKSPYLENHCGIIEKKMPSILKSSVKSLCITINKKP